MRVSAAPSALLPGAVMPPVLERWTAQVTLAGGSPPPGLTGTQTRLRALRVKQSEGKQEDRRHKPGEEDKTENGVMERKRQSGTVGGTSRLRRRLCPRHHAEICRKACFPSSCPDLPTAPAPDTLTAAGPPGFLQLPFGPSLHYKPCPSFPLTHEHGKNSLPRSGFPHVELGVRPVPSREDPRGPREPRLFGETHPAPAQVPSAAHGDSPPAPSSSGFTCRQRSTCTFSFFCFS